MGTKRKPRDLPDQQPAAKSRRITYDAALLHNSSPSDTQEVELGAQDLSPEFAHPLSEPELIGDAEFEDQVEKDLPLEDAAFGSQLESQQVPEEPAESVVHDSQHFPLTRENLERLAMSTNTKAPKTETAESTHSGKSDGPKTLSTTAEGFQNRALANGILDPGRSGRYPVKAEAIKKTLDESRRSASPTQSQYNKFNSRLNRAANEQETILAYDKFVLLDTDELHFESGYDRKVDKMWTEFPKEVGFNNGLSVPKPDIFEGFVKNTFPPTIKAIKSATLVNDKPRYVALPHMAIEHKAEDKSGHQAKVQAGYDGAAMVYSRNEALKYMGQEDAPREPSVLTAAVTGPQWEVYGHYAHPNEDTGHTEYYQHRLAGGSMVSLDDYKQGRKALRNMQDFGREQATDLRDRMKKDYDEHGLRRPKKGTADGSSRGDNSAASNPPFVILQKSAGNLPSPGQLTPKTAPSNAFARSA